MKSWRGIWGTGGLIELNVGIVALRGTFVTYPEGEYHKGMKSPDGFHCVIPTFVPQTFDLKNSVGSGVGHQTLRYGLTRKRSLVTVRLRVNGFDHAGDADTLDGHRVSHCRALWDPPTRRFTQIQSGKQLNCASETDIERSSRALGGVAIKCVKNLEKSRTLRVNGRYVTRFERLFPHVEVFDPRRVTRCRHLETIFREGLEEEEEISYAVPNWKTGINFEFLLTIWPKSSFMTLEYF
ncbi:hypothetical protein B0H19DRAFT_1064583 [Mycena capillaripes]|nr:hypothetical protein B0H19DRAFT_1064583 [Mycena capillaripes]